MDRATDIKHVVDGSNVNEITIKTLFIEAIKILKPTIFNYEYGNFPT